jgi:hypothetical protein
MNPFDYINAISYNKDDLFQEAPQVAEKEYVPFVINRGLSYFPDTLFYAAEMNRYHLLPKQMQFDFLRLAVPKRKRFSKWAKKQADSADIELVKLAYKYSDRKALEVLSILSKEQLEAIALSMDKGGK